jgi:hypothetical protein
LQPGGRTGRYRLRKNSSALSFGGAAGDEESRIAFKNAQSEILRVVYPERQGEILRCAQNDSERAQDDSIIGFFRSLFSPVVELGLTLGVLTPEAMRFQGLKARSTLCQGRRG